MPVCCARILSVVFSSRPCLIYFLFGKIAALFKGSPVQKWPSKPEFINKFMGACHVWNCVLRKFKTKISQTFWSGTTFHIRFVQKSTLMKSKLYRTIYTFTITSTYRDSRYNLYCLWIIIAVSVAITLGCVTVPARRRQTTAAYFWTIVRATLGCKSKAVSQHTYVSEGREDV